MNGRFAFLMILTTTVVVSGCAGYVPGSKAYWDGRVKEMCERDGHVQIIERVALTKYEAALLRDADGSFSLPSREQARIDAPVFLENQETQIREGNPRVRRTEWTVIRRADNKVVARWFSFGRVGGDFPSPAHDSSFRCPDWKQTWLEMEQLFLIAGQ